MATIANIFQVTNGRIDTWTFLCLKTLARPFVIGLVFFYRLAANLSPRLSRLPIGGCV
jgi:hypothetical protein